MAIKQVSRTLITMEGRIRTNEIAAVLEALNEYDFVDVQHAYDKISHETKLWLYPCKIYVVEYGDNDDEPVESCERKIIMKGSLPKNLHFITEHWMQFRKRAKKTNDNARYVALTVKDVFKSSHRESSEADYTELCLIVDGRCPPEDRSEVLNRAANFVRDELRAIVEVSSPALMQSVRTMDAVSCDIADILAELSTS